MDKKKGDTLTVKLPSVSFTIQEIKARIEALELDIERTTINIKDASLMRSSLRGGVIELKRLLKEKVNEPSKVA